MTDEGFWAYLQRQLRRRRLSQSDLARLIGVRPSTVSRWKTQAPSTEILRRLSPVLGVSVVELFVKAGHLEPEETAFIEEPDVEPVDPVMAAIDADPDIKSDEDREKAKAMIRLFRGEGGGGAGGSSVTDGDDKRAQRL